MRSMGWPRAVSMITGTFERARSVRQSVRPSSPGIIRSRTIRSMRAVSSAFHMAVPSAAVSVRNPLLARYSERSVRISRSSSTTRICGCAFMSQLWQARALPGESGMYRNVSARDPDTDRYKCVLGRYTPVHVDASTTTDGHIRHRVWEPCEKHIFPNDKECSMNTLRKSLVIAIATFGLGTIAAAAPSLVAQAPATSSASGQHGEKFAERMAKRQAA